MLKYGGWRSKLMAAWWIGLGQRHQFLEQLGELLTSDNDYKTCLAYVTAMALLGGEQSRLQLRGALDQLLRTKSPNSHRIGLVLGALAYVEGGLPTQYLDPSTWRHLPPTFDPLLQVKEQAELMSFIKSHDLVQTRGSPATW
jgi:hypothetical protein